MGRLYHKKESDVINMLSLEQKKEQEIKKMVSILGQIDLCFRI